MVKKRSTILSENDASAEVLSLEERIAELEADNAGMKKVGLLLVILTILIGALMVFKINEFHSQLTSGGLILSDEGGNPRAALTVFKPEQRNGHLGMLFYDNLGLLPPEVDFGRTPDLDGMVFYDRKGRPRIILGVDNSEQAVLLMTAPDGRVVFRAGLDSETASQTDAESSQPQTAATPVASPTPAASPE